MSRRGLLTAAVLLPVAAGCSSGSSALPQGWNRVLSDGVYIPVPSAWKHTAAGDDLAMFSSLWVEDQKAAHTIAVGTPLAGAGQALGEADAALRAGLPGYRVTTQRATAEREGATLTYQDFESTASGAQTGRLWVLDGEAGTVAVVLMAASLNTSYRDVLDDGISPGGSAGLPAIPDAWTRVGLAGASAGIPRAWTVMGAPADSERWRAGWADADLDGTARARLLLAPDMRKPTAADALAQIEADSIAGSLPGYARRNAPAAITPGEGLAGLRIDFRYNDDSQGTLWALERQARVAVVQLAFAGSADDDLTSQMEKSLWLTTEG